MSPVIKVMCFIPLQFSIEKYITNYSIYVGGQGASGVAVLGDIHEFPIHPLELWGQFCCHLAAQPQCMTVESLSGWSHVKVH